MRFLYSLVVLLFGCSPLMSQGIQDGLVFYAPFDGSTVNLVEWVKPRNYGASFTSDKFGQANHAISFNGVGDYLDYGNILEMGQHNFSVSVWVKAEDLRGRIISKGSGKDGYGFQLSADLYELALPRTKAHAWRHLVLTRSGERVQLYLDGQLVAVQQVSPLADLGVEEPLTLGALIQPVYGQESDFFHGALDELRIYNRRLSLHDVELLYEQFQRGPEHLTKKVAPLPITLSAYPNPTSPILNLKFTDAQFRLLRILDTNGRQLRFQQLENAQEAIPVAALPPGTYFIRVEEGQRVVTKRFLKVGEVLP